jgi:hypothetical protein
MKLFKVTGDRFELRVPLMKYDERTGEFEGWATLEQLDHSGEICDIEKSWPFFKAWSDKLAKATDGENLGNVREMHENIAAGKLTAIEKTIHPLGVPGIYVKGLAVDAGSKDKLTKRVLVGLSIGGKYVEKSKDPEIDGAIRFVADPMEISLVDAPCVPDAMITVVKADGSQEMKKAVGFQPAQFWACRNVAHRHINKSDAKVCDGQGIAGKIAKGGVSELLLEKSLYAASSIASVIMSATGVINELAWEARYDGDPADASPNDKLVAATSLLFDALLEIVDDEKSDFLELYGDDSGAANGSPTPDGPAVSGDPVFMLTALAEHMKKSPSILKSLRVQSGNGSNSNTEQENNTMDEKQIKKAAEDHLRARLAPFAKQLGLAEDADVLAEIVKRLPAGTAVVAAPPAPLTGEGVLVKSISDLTGVVTGMRDDLKKDRERVDAIEKSIDTMGGVFAKTLAIMSGVDVEDDGDLEQVLKAIEGKPAAPKAKVRATAVSKRKDSADPDDDDADEKPSGNPLVTEAKLLSIF